MVFESNREAVSRGRFQMSQTNRNVHGMPKSVAIRFKRPGCDG